MSIYFFKQTLQYFTGTNFCDRSATISKHLIHNLCPLHRSCYLRGEILFYFYRINAGFVPKEHWTQDPVEGGGRIIGEVCHFVDLLSYLIGSSPIKVYADVITTTRDDMMSKDNTGITFKYRDGSIATIIYTASGDRSFPKERIEIFNENSVAVIDDFRKVTFSRNGKVRTFGSSKQDKGYKQALNAFVDCALHGTASPISLQESVNATVATLKILESLSLGKPVDISLDDRQEFLQELSQIHTKSLQDHVMQQKTDTL